MAERKDIIIDAPESLSPGQNLYAQSPFRELIQSVSQKLSLSTEFVAGYITNIALLVPWEEIQNMPSQDRWERVKTFAQKVSSTTNKDLQNMQQPSLKHIGSKEDYENIMREILLQSFDQSGYALHKYPYWYDYIKSVRTQTNHLYDKFGNPSHRRPQEYANFSYAAWVKHTLHDPTIQEVLVETFPAWTIDPATPRPTSTGRRYRIPQATDTLES